MQKNIIKNYWVLTAFMMLAFLGFTITSNAHAILRVDITEGSSDPIRIATPEFKGQNNITTDVAKKISSVIDKNLESSGLFQLINKNSYTQVMTDSDTIPVLANWRSVNAQTLLAGDVRVDVDGNLRVVFRLWDILTGRQTLAKSFRSTKEGWRRIAHLISDEVYKYLTGEDGYFDSRIVYIAETGNWNKKTKRLAIMDQDGENQMFLTSGKSLVLTPRFDPNMQRIVYLSYRTRTPSVHLYNLSTGYEEAIGKLPGMSFAPRISPDGKYAIFSISVNGNTDIYEMELGSKRARRITRAPDIETSPSYSPDMSQIVYNSDEESGQQIYVMDRNGQNKKRISYNDGRYATPVWSPRGDKIAFTKMKNGRFYIGVMNPDGTGERLITESYLDEGPTWSPNGRMIIFTRTEQGSKTTAGKSYIYSIDVTGYNLRRLPTNTEASDPSWSPLLSK